MRIRFILRPLLFLQILFISLPASSQPKYRVSDIPKNLLTDAKAVVRTHEIEFEIKGINSAVQRVTYVITILNANGLENSVLTEFYNKFLLVRKIKWDIYDQNGNPVKNRTNTEVQDYSAISGYSLYEDNRVKLVDPKCRTIPFTVEYSYEIVYDGLLFFPVWKVYDDFNVSVERSSFKIIKPKEFEFRYLEKNLPESCIINDIDEKTFYTWEVKNKPAIIQEPFSIPYEDYTPVVYSAPNDFELGGYKGNCLTWVNFSRWIDRLDEGRDALGEESVKKIKELTSGLESDYEKIEAVYGYMQSKVRYVSVQTGIGGWQATDAETVDRLCYGDCKALANYMKCLLEIVGIKSHYALVLAGENSPAIMEDFPSNQFNHAMICIPLLNDTVWLECTNQHIPAGYIGKFTDNRKVLLTGEGGGILARTRVYTMNDNIQNRYANVILDPGGNAESFIRTSYSGTFYDEVYPILRMDVEDRKTFLQKRIPIPSYEISDFNHVEKRKIVPSIDEEMRLHLKNYGTIMGNRMLVTLNLMTRFKILPYRTSKRQSAIRIRRSYSESDTLIFTLPLLYKVDKVPESNTIRSRFGEYSTEIFHDGKEIRYIRTFKLDKGDYPAADYEEYIGFCEKVSGADEEKIILLKD